MFNVYKITNSINDKVYVGRTVHTLKNRWEGHLKRFYAGDKRAIYCAMRKYGVDNFKIELIEECSSYEDMVYKEAYYCKQLNAYTHGYNMTTAGEINPMECAKSKQSHDNKMRSEAVRSKISNSMKAVRARSKNHIYIHRGKEQKRIPPEKVADYLLAGWEKGTFKGKIKLHNIKGKETTIFEENLKEYLDKGWIRGGKSKPLSQAHRAKLKQCHKNISDTFRKEQSLRLKNYYLANPYWKTKSKKKVKIINPNTGETQIFDSCLDAARKTDIPESAAKAGKFAQWVKLGYIKRRKSMYNNYKVEFVLDKGGDNT